jgi:hypothetical protein
MTYTQPLLDENSNNKMESTKSEQRSTDGLPTGKVGMGQKKFFVFKMVGIFETQYILHAERKN